MEINFERILWLVWTGLPEANQYVSTHWLCTDCCINWKLKKYSALQSYFLYESEKDKQCEIKWGFF